MASKTAPGSKTITAAQFLALAGKPGGGIGRTAQPGARPKPYTPPDLGFRVRSKWEANYARYLRWLQAQGRIARWAYEPTTFWFEAIKRGTRHYTPDFLVVETDGRERYIEIKGFIDAKSKTRMKRMKRYHPSVEIVMLEGPAYRALAKTVAGLVPGWE